MELSNKQAKELYDRLLGIHLSDSDWDGKSRALRTFFDRLLEYELCNRLGVRSLDSLDKKDREKFNGYERKIEFLHDTSHPDYRMLNMWRKKFNRLSHEGEWNGKKSYQKCFSDLVNYISRQSGCPLSPALALVIHEDIVDEKIPERHVVFMNEIFNSYSPCTERCSIEDGVRFVKAYRDFVSGKKARGLDNVVCSLLTYNSSLGFETEFRYLDADNGDAVRFDPGFDSDERCEIEPPVNLTLNVMLDLVTKILAAKPRLKPWLIWICSDIPANVDISLIDEIRDLIKHKEIALYAIPTTQMSKKRFEELFDTKRVYEFNPAKAELFFDSISMTLRRAHEKGVR